MATFSSKKIITFLSVNEQLAAQRQQRGINLTEAASLTKVSAHHLQALEDGDYSKLPGEVYTRSFLKVYAKFLGLDASKLLSQYLKEREIYNKTQPTENTIDIKKPVERVLWHNLIVTPKIIRNAIIGILIIICLTYLGLKVKAIVSPPFLSVSSPANNLVIPQKVIEIVGQAEAEAILKINGQIVLTDKEGNFSERVVLQQGINVIEISAKKKHSRQALIYRKVIVTEEE